MATGERQPKSLQQDYQGSGDSRTALASSPPQRRLLKEAVLILPRRSSGKVGFEATLLLDCTLGDCLSTNIDSGRQCEELFESFANFSFIRAGL